VVQALPVLTEAVTVSHRAPAPAPQATLASKVPAPAKRFKQSPLPRAEIKTEDVYTMIESALARIALTTAVGRN